MKKKTKKTKALLLRTNEFFFFLCSLCREKTEFFLDFSSSFGRVEGRKKFLLVREEKREQKRKKKRKIFQPLSSLCAQRKRERGFFCSRREKKGEKNKENSSSLKISHPNRFCCALKNTTPITLILLIEERVEREYI